MKSLLTDYPVTAPMCRYLTDESRKLHIEEYAGRIGLEDLKDVAAMVSSDTMCSGTIHRLIDLSDARLDLTSDEVLRYALLMRRENLRTEGWCVFAVGDAATFSIARMFSHWARTSERSRFFSSREEAERWLNRNIGRTPDAVAVKHVA
jgi:hypothetical protein